MALTASAFTLTAAGSFGIRNITDATEVLPLLALPATAMAAGLSYTFNEDLGDGVLLPAGKSAGIGFTGAITSGTFHVMGAIWGTEE